MTERVTEYDLVVVGTGIASTPARKCAKEGWRVALIDNRPPGGTCALRGCSPKKLLRAGAEALDKMHRMFGRGVAADNLRGNWQGLQKHKDDYCGPIPENNTRIYKEQGIHFLQGTASFAGPDRILLKQVNGDLETLVFRHAVLATGARPTPLSMPGADVITSSDEFLELDELPKQIVFVGGGFISMEFAHIAARYGSKCTVIHSRKYPLNPFDPDLVGMLVEASREEAGIQFRLQSRVDRVRQSDGGLVVHARCGDGHECEVEADMVVHGAGRVPNLDDLDLEKGEVAASRRGVTVSEFLQSPSNPRVYAAGDCSDSGAPQLSFSAVAEGLAVSRNLLEGNRHTVDYTGQASVCYTLPCIARAGMTEQEARDSGFDIDVRFGESTRWFTNRYVNEPVAGYKIIIEKETDRILGAHFLAHHGEEFVNVFALAIRQKLTREEIKQTLWAHPSAGSDLSRMLGSAQS